MGISASVKFLIPSETKPIGGLSIIITSYAFFNSSTISLNLLLNKSSDGFGGIGPAVIKSRFSVEEC